MGTVEVLQSERTEPDRLKEARKEIGRIDNLALSKNLRINITILGALHEGIPSLDILDAISHSDCTSLELPSNVVKAFAMGEETRIDGNAFWGTVIENSQDAVGVNTNRAAVNGIRILDDRVREGQNIPDSFPDLAVSARDMKFGIGGDIQRVKISDPSTISELKKQEQEWNNVYPGKAFVMKEGKAHYVHVNRPLPEGEVQALLVSGNYMLPTEYYMNRGEEIFGGEVGGIAGAEFAEFALSHLIRMQVDKAQVNGMLKKIYGLAKGAPSGTEITFTHVGGAAHNPNIMGILHEVVASRQLIAVTEARDERMPETSPDKLTFFGKLIPIVDALGAVELVDDQVLVNVKNTDEILQKYALGPGLLREFGRRERLARAFEDAVPECDNSGQVEYFAVRNLLSLIPPQEAESLGSIDSTFPEKLSDYIRTQYPHQRQAVMRVMEQYRARQFNFPPKKVTVEI